MNYPRPLAQRILTLLSDGQPRWVPQIAAHLEGSPAPLPAVEACLRFLTTRGVAPLRIVPKRGYTLCHSLPEVSQAIKDLDARLFELHQWRDGLQRWYNSHQPRQQSGPDAPHHRTSRSRAQAPKGKTRTR